MKNDENALVIPDGVVEDFGDYGDEALSLGVVIKAYAPIGSVSGMGRIQVEAREIVDVDARSIAYFTVLTVTGSGTNGSSSSVTVPVAETGRIMAAIARLVKTSLGLTKFPSFEVIFETESGLRIIVFNASDGTLNAAVGAKSVTCYFKEVARLGEVATLLGRARDYIEENQISI